MAHSQLLTIANRGDAARMTHGAGSFIIELGIDPRVRALREQWHQARVIGGQALDQALERGRFDEATIHRIIDGYSAQERLATQRFVRDVLELKESWVVWVGDALLHLFRLSVYNEQHPDAPQQFSIPVFLSKGSPQGRLPRQQGLDIERNMRWFYRAHVKRPPDSVHDLAADYASYVNRENDARSVVQNGIKQAERLLDFAAERAIRLPPH
jgi:hypothetical protein